MLRAYSSRLQLARVCIGSVSAWLVWPGLPAELQLRERRTLPPWDGDVQLRAWLDGGQLSERYCTRCLLAVAPRRRCPVQSCSVICFIVSFVLCLCWKNLSLKSFRFLRSVLPVPPGAACLSVAGLNECEFISNLLLNEFQNAFMSNTC